MADYKIWKRNLWSLFMGQMIVNISFGLCIPFISYYLIELDPNQTEAQLTFYTGLCSTIPSAAMAVAAPIWGFVSDIYGRKKMLVFAMTNCMLVLMFSGFAKTVPMFLFMRLCSGIFTGTMSPALSLASNSAPRDKMSYTLGLISSSTFLGWALGQLLASPVVALTNYSCTFLAGAALMVVGIACSLIPVEIPGTYGKDLYLQHKAEKKAKKAENKKASGGMISLTVILMLLSIMLLRMGRTMFSPFTALFVRETLGTMEGATFYTGLINGVACLVTAVSTVTLTKLADRYDRIKYSLVLLGISVVFELLLIPKFPLWLFIVFYSGVYFFGGTIEPIITSAMSEITDSATRGMLFGLISTVNNLAMVFSPMIASSLSVAFGFRAILVAMPILLCITGVILIGIMLKSYNRAEQL